MMFYCLRAKFLILFQCKPHVRGDGPAVDDILLDFAGVNPTYMGMNRGGDSRHTRTICKPRACGDEPHGTAAYGVIWNVNPTYVGMDLLSWS